MDQRFEMVRCEEPPQKVLNLKTNRQLEINFMILSFFVSLYFSELYKKHICRVLSPTDLIKTWVWIWKTFDNVNWQLSLSSKLAILFLVGRNLAPRLLSLANPQHTNKSTSISSKKWQSVWWPHSSLSPLNILPSRKSQQKNVFLPYVSVTLSKI